MTISLSDIMSKIQKGKASTETASNGIRNDGMHAVNIPSARLLLRPNGLLFASFFTKDAFLVDILKGNLISIESVEASIIGTVPAIWGTAEHMLYVGRKSES